MVDELIVAQLLPCEGLRRAKGRYRHAEL